MSETLEITLHNRPQAWADIKTRLYPALARVLQGGATWVLTIKPETRTQAQNRLMWPLLTAFSKSLQWPVDGRMGLSGPGLQALREVIGWHDAQRSSIARSRYEQAIRLTEARTRSGHATIDLDKILSNQKEAA